MTRDDLTSFLTRVIHPAESEALAAGQSEYANSDNAFGNFDRLTSTLGISRMAVLLVYLMKHIDGITSYIRGHRSQREDIRGRIKDARAYLAILWAMVEEKGDNGEREAENKYWQHINDRLRQEQVIGVCIQPKDNNGRALIRFNVASRKQASGETCNRNYWTTVEGDINVGDFVKSNSDGSVSAIPAYTFKEMELKDYAQAYTGVRSGVDCSKSQGCGTPAPISFWHHFCGARSQNLIALPSNREHCDACGEHQSCDVTTKRAYTPWKHSCSKLSVPESQIMVYTTLCPYCFAAS